MKRFSKKREAILEAIRSTDTHPSAEWVYTKLKPDFPDLSLATVYRNIAEFLEDGTIVSVGTVSGQERYDAYVEPHTHFICSCCGAVIDVESKIDTAVLNETVGKSIGAQIDRHELYFRGKCANCL